jgi:hypothetical protein
LLKLHPDFSYRVDLVGAEQQKVLVVEPFLENPEWLIEYCSKNKAEFNSTDAMYPGVRMPAPAEYIAAIATFLKPIILDVFELDERRVNNIFSAFSLVMIPPDQLKPEQVIPHFDSNNRNDVASIYYLCDPKFGGTSLYRHSPTGNEYIDKVRLTPYMTSLRDSFQAGHIERAYINGANKVFERIATYPAKFNSFVMYRCTSLHSGDIAKDFAFCDDPEKARLTIATFIGSDGE